MSGIVGIFNLDGSKADRNILDRLASTISHRGTDGRGVYLDDTIGLAHRKHTITALSEQENQPVVDENSSYVILHDARIYNSADLHQELEEAGHLFHTTGETEVILNSYKQWGVECLHKFNGMWSFAIWDKEKETLFCARDRFGIKPFYFYFDNKVFIFASEIKAILSHPYTPKKVNEQSIYCYILWGLFDFSGETFFKGIKELRPAHYILVNRQQGIRNNNWWSPNSINVTEIPENETENTIRQFRSLIEDTAKIRLDSEESVGIALSGGLDSSSVAVLADKFTHMEPYPSGYRLKTFCACYNDESIDERSFIETLIRKTGVESNYFYPDGYKLWEELPKLLWYFDEPSNEGSVYARWGMMNEAQKLGIKIILDGDGGDEALAGYHRYYANLIVELSLKCQLLKLLTEVKKTSSIIGTANLGSHLKMVLGGILYTRLPYSIQASSRNILLNFEQKHSHRCINPSFDRQYYKYGLDRLREEHGKATLNLRHILNRDLFWLTNALRYTDRISTVHSIETRFPFFDHRLMEFAFGLPENLKIKNGWTKWLLRQAMKDVLPSEILFQTRKLASGESR
jgi:asparagine synthase (glutamine-hydrolysing)